MPAASDGRRMTRAVLARCLFAVTKIERPPSSRTWGLCTPSGWVSLAITLRRLGGAG
jgi:hypothetical protein